MTINSCEAVKDILDKAKGQRGGQETSREGLVGWEQEDEGYEYDLEYKTKRVINSLTPMGAYMRPLKNQASC
jgi:hypothetical protein